MVKARIAGRWIAGNDHVRTARVTLGAGMPLDCLFPLLAAPIAGSVIGVLIARLPHQRPIALDRSRCDHCHAPLAPADLVPIASYLVLRGRCRQCGAPIGWFHLAVELAALAIAAIAVAVDGVGLDVWLACGLGWTLVALAWIDWRHMILPDALTLPLAVAGLCVTELLDAEALAEHVVAALLAFAAFRVIALAHERWRGFAGLGQGDAKLLATGGAWLGASPLPTVVLGAALTTLAVLLLARSLGRQVSRTKPIPFGPALCLWIWLCWLGA